MHEPSGPLSVLHRVKHAQNPPEPALPPSQENAFFVGLCKQRSSELLVAEQRSYADMGGKLGRWCSQICQHLVQNHPRLRDATNCFIGVWK